MSDEPRTIGGQAEHLPARSLHKWLPERMFACLIIGIVERLDLRGLARTANRNSAYNADPAVMVALLFYGYTSGVFSSRELERATYRSDTFRFIAANTHPHHLVISSFRKRFSRELERLFVRMLAITYMMRQIAKGEASLDRKELEKKLRKEVSALLRSAEAADAETRGAGADARADAGAAADADADAGTGTGTGAQPRNIPNQPVSKASEHDPGHGAATRPPDVRPAHAGMAHIQHQTPGEEPGQAATGRGIQCLPHGEQRTYTFLSKQQAVLALASDISKSITTPLFMSKPTTPDGAEKPLATVHTQGAPRQKRDTTNNGTILLVAGLTAVLLVAGYIVGNGSYDPTYISHSAESIDQAENHDTLPKADFAALSAEVEISIDTPETPPITTDNAVSDAADNAVSDAADNALPAVPEQPSLATEAEDTPRLIPAPEPTTVQAQLTDAETAETPSTDAQAQTIQREDWLLEQPATSYMLQLLWVRNETSLNSFVDEHQLSGNVAYYKDRRNGKDRYVLLYGSYSTRQAAIDAIETFPAAVRKNRPWPRKLTSVQTSIIEQRNLVSH